MLRSFDYPARLRYLRLNWQTKCRGMKTSAIQLIGWQSARADCYRSFQWILICEGWKAWVSLSVNSGYWAGYAVLVDVEKKVSGSTTP